MFDRSARREIEAVARSHQIDPAKLLGVAWVESAGTPFWRIDGKNEPVIRFEGHYFYKRLSGAKRDRAVREGLASPRAGGVKNPKSAAARYDLLRRAMAIDPVAALESISMGLGQVMGAWWKDLGYTSVQAMWQDCRSGIAGQVTVMVKYIAVYGLMDELRAGKWKAFAAGYNGPSYAVNRYDAKIAAAVKAFSAADPDTVTDRATENTLRKLGYADRTAIEDFQSDRGLIADGAAGPIVQEELQEAIAEDRATRAPGNAGTAAGIGTGVAIGAPAVIKQAPDIIDAIREGGDTAWSVQSIVDAIGLPGIVGGVIVAGIVGYIVYRLVKRAQPADTPRRPGLFARLKSALP